MPAKSDALTKHEKIGTMKQKQTHRSQKGYQDLLFQRQQHLKLFGMLAYYFPGALPKLSEVIIFVNPLGEKLSKTTMTTTTTLNLGTTPDLKSSKMHTLPTGATKS